MPAAPFIEQAPAGVSGWAACFAPADLPVLAETASSLEAFRANEDEVDARVLAELISADPLLTIKVLAHVADLQRRRAAEGRGDTETVTAALVLLGIGPFFRAFGPQPTVEEALADRPEALDGFRAVLRRSHRAANFAIAFAVHRMDQDAAVIHEAALLHDFAELLLWVRAPSLALAIAARQQDEPGLRSAAIQRELLHMELADLQQALMLRWRLPELLVKISDERHADSDQVRNVLIAIRVARHSSRGWDNAALPDDVAEVAALLHLGEAPTLNLLHDIDA
ncbi:MAG: HDOD domain-containing protein [Burkholderiales bacterium]|nr:HDOD domain-containing protein [Burkholderiales bacterium]MDE2394161.1 HDOD domain-containing protein [Burkholderiales bacterium]